MFWFRNGFGKHRKGIKYKPEGVGTGLGRWVLLEDATVIEDVKCNETIIMIEK